MEVQFHFSIKIYPHVRAKLLALVALLCASALIVGAQWLFPQAAPGIGCLLLACLYGYANWPRTHYTTSTPIVADTAEVIPVHCDAPAPAKPVTPAKVSKPRTRKAAVVTPVVYTNGQAVPA